MKIDKNLKNVAMQAVGITGGNIAANYLGKAVDAMSFIPETLKPYAAPVLNVAGGVLVATKLAKKQPLMQSVGVGMAAKGIQQLIGHFVPSLGISGLNDAYNPAGFVGATDTYVVEVPSAIENPYSTSTSTVAGIGVANDNNGTFTN